MTTIKTDTTVCSLTLDEIHALRLEAADERRIGKLDTVPKDGILDASEISNGLRTLDSRKSVSKLYLALFAQTPPKALNLLKDMEPQARLTLLMSLPPAAMTTILERLSSQDEEGIRDLAHIIRYVAQVDTNGVFGALFFRQMDPKTVARAIAYPVPSNDPSAFKKYLKTVSAYSPKNMPLMRQVEYYPTREQAEAKAKEKGWDIADKTSAKYGLRLAFVESSGLKGVLIVPDGKDCVCIVESALIHRDTPEEKERRQRKIEKAFPPGFKFK